MELVHDALGAWDVDRARDVEGEVQNAHVESDEDLPSCGPILRILVDKLVAITYCWINANLNVIRSIPPNEKLIARGLRSFLSFLRHVDR